jgi:hypothetical protein
MKSAFTKVLFLSALILGTSSVAQAQFRQSIYLNLGLPTGGIASSVSTPHAIPLTYTEICKDARIGFGGGYRASYRFDVGTGEVAPFAQVDLFWNTINGDLSDEYTQARAEHTPAYFNVPIQVGVTYLYDELWNDVTPFGEFGLGTDILMISSEGPCTLTDALGNQTTSPKYAYKLNSKFSFSLGAGAYFGRHFSAGIYYYWMGKHTIEYTDKTLDRLPVAEQTAYNTGNVETRTVGTLALRLGFHF